jgi:hypothetical protein
LCRTERSAEVPAVPAERVVELIEEQDCGLGPDRPEASHDSGDSRCQERRSQAFLGVGLIETPESALAGSKGHYFHRTQIHRQDICCRQPAAGTLSVEVKALSERGVRIRFAVCSQMDVAAHRHQLGKHVGRDAARPQQQPSWHSSDKPARLVGKNLYIWVPGRSTSGRAGGRKQSNTPGRQRLVAVAC